MRLLIIQKYLDDQYLLLMVAVIVAPVLVSLIIQVSTFPRKLHQYEIVSEVTFYLFLFA